MNKFIIIMLIITIIVTNINNDNIIDNDYNYCYYDNNCYNDNKDVSY